MAQKLDKEKVKQWLRGQEETQKIIGRERAERLRKMTTEESLKIYLDLKAAEPPGARDLTKPSPFLWAMRQFFDKYAEAKRGRD